MGHKNFRTIYSLTRTNHELTPADFLLKINEIEDALQYYTSIHHKLDYFISVDKELKKVSIPTLPVYTPGEYLKQLK